MDRLVICDSSGATDASIHFSLVIKWKISILIIISIEMDQTELDHC